MRRCVCRRVSATACIELRGVRNIRDSNKVRTPRRFRRLAGGLLMNVRGV